MEPYIQCRMLTPEWVRNHVAETVFLLKAAFWAVVWVGCGGEGSKGSLEGR